MSYALQIFEATRPIYMRPSPDAMRPRSRPRPERVRPRLRPRPNDLASRPHGHRGLNIPVEKSRTRTVVCEDGDA